MKGRKERKMKKTLTILLSLALVICMIPSVAFAAGETMTASLSAYTALYSGSAQELPAVTNVKVDKTTLTDGQYSVQWTDSSNGMVQESSVTAAGTYTATIKDTRAEGGTGATVKKTFTIEKVDFKKASVTYSGVITAKKVDGKTTEELKEMFSDDENLTVKYSGYSTPVAKELYEVSNVVVDKDGYVTIYVEGISNNSNVVSATIFTKNQIKTELNDDNFKIYGSNSDGSIPDRVYNGSEYKPTITVKSQGEKVVTLTKDKDYSVSYSNNIEGGRQGVVTVKGIGKYYGEISATFNITQKPVTSTGISITVGNAPQGGEPVVTVKDGTKTLKDGTDYYTTGLFSDEKGTGAGSITVIGTGNYGGEKTVKFDVVDSANDIANAEVTVTNRTFTYKNTVQKPTVKVVLDKKELKVNTDYTLSYYYYNEKNEKISTAEPKDAAVYFIDVVGKGSYAGKTGSLNYFEIERYSFNWVEINVSQASKNSTPVVTVKSIDKGFSFVKDKDFTVSDPYVYSGGTKGSVTITSTGKGNLGEGSKQVDYLIAGKSMTSCTASFVGDKTVYQYTGNEIIPSIKVYDGSVLLTKGKDYTITYKNSSGNVVTAPREAGKYTLIIEGLNGYTGTKTLSFEIKGTDISDYTVTLRNSSVNATGYSQTPVITSVKKGTYYSLSSSDYTVTYQDSTGKTVSTMSAPGTYKVVVTGKNGYSGSTSASFRIVGTPQTVTVNQDSYKVYDDSDSFTIKASATGDGTGFSYTSSDAAVASVTSAGIVTPHKVGKAVITVTTTGNKKSEPTSKEVIVKVYPDKVKISKKPWTDGKKAQMKVRWGYQDGVTKYQVRYSRDKKFKSGTYLTKTVKAHGKDYTTQSTTISKLKRGYTYYFKVRAVYTDPVTGENYYGSWSPWRSAKTK